MAEKPKPEFPTPVAVTRHPKLFRPRVGLTTLGQPRLSEGAQPYPRLRGSAQRETGDRMIGWGRNYQVTGLSRREPGAGAQVRVQVQDLNFARTRTCT